MTLLGLRFAIPAFDGPDAARWGFRVSATGRPETVTDADVTRQSILTVLSTVPGERVMRPAYGCRIHELAFAPNDDTTAGLAMHYVRRAVERWIPHAEIVAVDAFRDPADAGILRIRLDYRHRPTGLTDAVDVGFSLTGGTR